MTNPELLRSSDEAVRLRGVGELALSRAADVVPLLIRALDDTSWRVRQEAVKGLVRHGGPESVGAVLRALHDQHQNLGVLNGAIQILAQAGVDTLEELTAFLTDPDPGLRTCAALTLGTQNNPRAVPALIRAVDDSDANVRFHAIEALGRLRASEAVDVLAAVAESRDFALAFPALEALAAIGDGRAGYRLLPLLEDELLQSAVLEVLGQVGGAEVVAPLANLVNAAASPVGSVAQALARLHGRYETSYRQGDLIVGLARQGIAPAGVQNLLDAFESLSGPDLPAVALVLGWLDNDTLDRFLVELLGRPTVRSEVVAALVRRGPRVTALLVEQLRADNLATRQDAVLALGRIGDSRAVPALLETSNPELTVGVAGALAMIGDRRAYAPLLDLLGHDDGAIRRAVISALNSLGHPDMAADIVRLCRVPQPLVRESAVRVAGYIGFPECAESILACCHDDSTNVRRAAVEVLSALEDDRGLVALAAALADDEPGVRAAAARALGQMAGADAWPLLQKALEDVGPWVRYYAVRSVGCQKFAPALDALSRLAQADPAMQVRVAAVEAIGAVGGTRVLPLLLSLADAPDQDLARAALAALGATGHPDALPPLLASLDSADEARRLGALQALGKSGLAEALPALQRVVVGNSNADVVDAGISALAQFPRPEAVDVLIALTALPASRAACVAALARAASGHLTPVAQGLSHSLLDVRRAVVEALARTRDPEAVAPLLRALEDAGPSVRLAALTALAFTATPLIEQKLTEFAATDPDAFVRRAAQARLRR
jgi:HEAT repeat protein